MSGRLELLARLLVRVHEILLLLMAILSSCFLTPFLLNLYYSFLSRVGRVSCQGFAQL